MSELHLQGKHVLLATMPIQHMEEGRVLRLSAHAQRGQDLTTKQARIGRERAKEE
jgi:hypothetical protein